jgi:uncharacterized membrane protein
LGINYLFEEFRKGVSETSKYLFSHHEKNEYYKCFLFNIKNKKIAFCSRCLGIYLGIIFGLLLFNIINLNKHILHLILIFFPFFTLMDWSLTTFTKFKSNNIIRVTTGFFLGIAYIFSIFLFFSFFPNYYVITIGFFYLILSLVLVKLKFKYQ